MRVYLFYIIHFLQKFYLQNILQMEKQQVVPTQRGEESEKRTLYQTYTDYIDPSEITIDYYLSRKFYPGQEQHIEKIKEWIQDNSQPNKPLIFRTSPGVGVKTILARWYQQTLEENASKKYKILPIIHFASNGGNSSNYFYCLYRIVIKLREALKLKQSVDLLEQKIRKYFAYWLDICSTQIEKQQVVFCTQDIYQKIIIVIEGVDKFTDSQSGKQANIAFWLPEIFPKNVKIICTVGQFSESLEYFEKKQCQILEILSSETIVNNLLEESLNKETLLNIETQIELKKILKNKIEKIKGQSDVYKFIQTFSSFLLIEKERTTNKQFINFFKQTIQKKLSQGSLSKVNRSNDLYDYIMSMLTDAAPFKKKLPQVLFYFALSQKGITVKEIMQLTRFTQHEWSFFNALFSPILIKHGQIYSIKCSEFIESIKKKNKDSKENIQTHMIKYHEKIAQALQSTPNSIRKLEEQTYHLFVSKSYFKLKQIVSTIENFLLMFNPNNKYELSRYWQKLEEKGFDPVIEYNKAIEGFAMHYHPSDENIFKIIVQISRFLKEFCDFETYQTPAFRHPLIEGNMVELQKIGLLNEFTELEIYVDSSFCQVDEAQNIPDCSLQEQIRQVREQHFPKDKQQQVEIKMIQEGPDQILKVIQNPVELQRINKKIKKKVTTSILSQIEQLNVDVPMNRQKFRIYYLNSLQQYMKNEDYKKKDQEGMFLDEQDNTQNEVKKMSKIREQFNVNKIKQNYRMRQIKPSLYYYKRWIWIQFPWVCISLNNNYSAAPEFCKQLECEDIDSYEQQAKYTKQALIVAIQAKQKKKMMFSKKTDDISGFGPSLGSRMRSTNYTSGKFSASRNIQRSVKRSKILQKSFTNIDLNLNSLTKELQLRKKNMPKEFKTQINQQQTGIFLSEINQNCQEDMKFINERKHFDTPDVEGLPSNQILPKLKWTIKDHTNYQINYIKNHIEEKKKKLNKIIFENKKLVEVYKQLKLKENMTKKNMNQQQSDKHSRKTKLLDEYTQKKEDVINQFCKSLLQKERLKIILKLCAQNKTKNEQYLASLNYFLQNLKKMIAWEKNNIKEVTTQMNGIKALREKKQYMEAQKEKNTKIVERQVKNYLEQKDKLEHQIQNISVIIADDLRDQKDKLQNSLEGHLKNREQKNILMMQQKKTKQLEDKLKVLQEEYECLKKLFEIDGTDFENSPKFQELLSQNEKNKKLKIIYFERKNKLQQVKKQYQKTKISCEKIKLQKKSEQNCLKLNFKSFKQQFKEKQLQNQTKNMNNLKIMLNNIALKIGVKSPSQIIPFLKSKLDELKISEPTKYEQIIHHSDKILSKGIR